MNGLGAWGSGGARGGGGHHGRGWSGGGSSGSRGGSGGGCGSRGRGRSSELVDGGASSGVTDGNASSRCWSCGEGGSGGEGGSRDRVGSDAVVDGDTSSGVVDGGASGGGARSRVGVPCRSSRVGLPRCCSVHRSDGSMRHLGAGFRFPGRETRKGTWWQRRQVQEGIDFAQDTHEGSAGEIDFLPNSDDEGGNVRSILDGKDDEIMPDSEPQYSAIELEEVKIEADWEGEVVGSDWETQEVGAVGKEKNGSGVGDLHRSLVTEAVVCATEDVPIEQFATGAVDIRGHSQASDLEDDVLENILNTLLFLHMLNHQHAELLQQQPLHIGWCWRRCCKAVSSSSSDGGGALRSMAMEENCYVR